MKNLFRKSPSIGSWITIGHPTIAEIMADSGFHWLAVDLEHSVITIREAEELIRIIDLKGVIPLVRLSSNNEVQIKRVIDGASSKKLIPIHTHHDEYHKKWHSNVHTVKQHDRYDLE